MMVASNFLPDPEKFFTFLIVITVVLAFVLLSGCQHQPPGENLWLLVR